MRSIYATVNLTCLRAVRLLSDLSERPPTRLERFGLAAHLLGCRSCRRYRRQQELLVAALRADDEPATDAARLSAEARARLAGLLAATPPAEGCDGDEGEPPTVS
jgi:hypothetical protein